MVIITNSSKPVYKSIMYEMRRDKSKHISSHNGTLTRRNNDTEAIMNIDTVYGKITATHGATRNRYFRRQFVIL